MGRDTDFYKLDREKATKHLVPLLGPDTRYATTFESFLAARNSEFPDLAVDYNEVMEIIRTDINRIGDYQLSEIIHYIGEEILNNKTLVFPHEIKSFNYCEYELTQHGIESIFSVVSVTAYSFMFQWGHYQDIFEPDEFFRNVGEGRNISTPDFLNFLDYIILLCRDLMNSEMCDFTYDYSEAKKTVILDIEERNKDNEKLRQLIEREFTFLLGLWNQYKDDWEDRNPDLMTITCADWFFERALYMKEVINPAYNTRIVVDDSY